MAPTDSGLGTREKILAAALDLIGRDGLEALTTRRVAEEAGVNLGLLHYYFASKDALRQEVLERFIGDLSSSLRIEGPVTDPEAYLVAVYFRGYSKILEKPGLFFGLMGQVLEVIKLAKLGAPNSSFPDLARTSDTLGPLVRAQALMVARVKETLAQVLGSDEELLSQRALQLFTSIFHPLLFTPMSSILYGVDLGEEEGRRAYVTGVVRDALRPVPPFPDTPSLDSSPLGQ